MSTVNRMTDSSGFMSSRYFSLHVRVGSLPRYQERVGRQAATVAGPPLTSGASSTSVPRPRSQELGPKVQRSTGSGSPVAPFPERLRATGPGAGDAWGDLGLGKERGTQALRAGPDGMRVRIAAIWW